MDYIMAFWNSWTTLLIRALLVIGPLFLVFWVIKPAWVKKLRIHQPRHKDVITLKEMPRFIFGLSVYLIQVWPWSFQRKLSAIHRCTQTLANMDGFILQLLF